MYFESPHPLGEGGYNMALRKRRKMEDKKGKKVEKVEKKVKGVLSAEENIGWGTGKDWFWGKNLPLYVELYICKIAGFQGL